MAAQELINHALPELMAGNLGGIGLPEKVPLVGGGGKKTIAAIGSAVLIVPTLLKAGSPGIIIHDGEVGLRTRLGRGRIPQDALWARDRRKGGLYGTVKPGFNPIIPFTDSVIRISLQDQNHELDTIEVDDDQKRQMKVISAVAWGVRDDAESQYRSVFAVEDRATLPRMVADICTAGLRSVLVGKSEEDMNNSTLVTSLLRHKINEPRHEDHPKDVKCLWDYGVEMRNLNVKTATPTFGQMIVRASSQSSLTPATLASLPGGYSQAGDN